ncbi:MAG: 1-acyl-sn-glycerol-3-phosphate acyltransferase [Thermoflexibacter sp.]|nr:1-acyl-sn-glycerol-3-phosphate acyltransferase [Thermoflexibacter sp.]
MIRRKEVVSKEEFIQKLKLKEYHLAWAADFLMSMIGVKGVNAVYASELDEPDGLIYLQKIMANMNITLDLPESNWSNIPPKGAFISVSNHPFGVLDGILLLLILVKARPDTKVMANFLLQRIDPIKHFFISVDPFETNNQTSRSLAGTKITLLNLKDGHPVGIFPSGEVSTLQKDKKLLESIPAKIQDRDWQIPVMKIIRKAQVPVVPIYFGGQNSAIFHFLGRINPFFRTLNLFNEFLNKEKQKIFVRIGEPISIEKQNEFEKLEDLASFLKKETYKLANNP